MLAVGCHVWPLLCWGMFPLPTFWIFFIISRCWILYLCIFLDNRVFFITLFMWCIILILWILKTFCILGLNPTWSWYMTLLLLYLVCWFVFVFVFFFWGLFHICSSVILAWFFFFKYFCLVLVSGWYWDHRMSS